MAFGFRGFSLIRACWGFSLLGGQGLQGFRLVGGPGFVNPYRSL